ncbi:MAG: ABC-F family ATP-binding cassette domain-containing protein [Ancalomicrobiaceae bacterium]|nr:ABC-F family ATP-binding cassette domain-containing protein [Ancalomicrobiaceae bacterium]
MSSIVTLSDLCWSLPDGRSLISHLNLSFGTERTGLVGRNGVGKTTLVRLIAGEIVPQSGSVTVFGRPGILEQMLDPPPSLTVADRFGVGAAFERLCRAEAGEASLDEMADVDWTLSARMAEALARMRLDVAPQMPMARLSGGERTRVNLAALVFRAPDILILDEPTNNLDRDGRRAVVELLVQWRGGAIVVSHDREVLDRMQAIVELTTLGATRYGGNYASYRHQKGFELAAAERELAEAEKSLADSGRRAQAALERKARSDKAGREKRDRGDQPKILLDAKKERSQATGSRLAQLADRQRDEALEAVGAARGRIEVLQPFKVTLASSRLPARKTVLSLQAVRFGYRADTPIIRDLSLSLIGPERVAVVGGNGSGKSTLVRLISGTLCPDGGTITVTERRTLLDQTVAILDPLLSIEANFRRINPEADANGCRAALARFMFRADAALQLAGSLSGGERMRAGLAAALGGPLPPELVILDEPTNHLDLGALETVEAGLRAYDGALLVVSHDERFLEAIGIGRRIDLGAGDGGVRPQPGD